MSDRSGSQADPHIFDARLLEQLACPVCFGVLGVDASSAILCTGCGRAYPLIDGIPGLIAERALSSE